MKRVLLFVLVVCMVLPIGRVSVEAVTGNNPVKLSCYNDEQCKQFLAERNITIPKEFGDIDLTKLFAIIEGNPNGHISVGWPVYAEFVKEVGIAVKEYYGIPDSLTTCAAAYTLQNSTLYSWEPSTMLDYNCYAYALGETTAYQPGYFSGKMYDGAADIDALATLVKSDLYDGLNYCCVKIQSGLPTTAGTWTNIIAVRKDTTFDIGINDYHFAKLYNGNWYHKPGTTAILKFNNSPSNANIWTNEAYYYGQVYEPTITYDSEIRFISYRNSHNKVLGEWTGEHYHAESMHWYLYRCVCADCGESCGTEWTSLPCRGFTCVMPWSYGTGNEAD